MTCVLYGVWEDAASDPNGGACTYFADQDEALIYARALSAFLDRPVELQTFMLRSDLTPAELASAMLNDMGWCAEHLSAVMVIERPHTPNLRPVLAATKGDGRPYRIEMIPPPEEA